MWVGISLVLRPPLRFYLAAVEEKPNFLHGYEIKSGQRHGNEASLHALQLPYNHCLLHNHLVIYYLILQVWVSIYLNQQLNNILMFPVCSKEESSIPILHMSVLCTCVCVCVCVCVWGGGGGGGGGGVYMCVYVCVCVCVCVCGWVGVCTGWGGESE